MVGIAKMLNIDEIHVIDWDGTAEHRGVFTSDELQNAPPIKEVIGGGGTNPRCVSDYLKDNNIKPDAVVMLTDGEIHDWGNWTVPLLWVICNASKITAPVGKTINID
jgi:predicted metal-dependent peptidase